MPRLKTISVLAGHALSGNAEKTPANWKITVNNTPYIIYTRSGFTCKWCDKAAELLDAKGMSYNLRPLSRPELLAKAAESHMSSIPIIYHGVSLVGGFSELKLYLGDTE